MLLRNAATLWRVSLSLSLCIVPAKLSFYFYALQRGCCSCASLSCRQTLVSAFHRTRAVCLTHRGAQGIAQLEPLVAAAMQPKRSRSGQGTSRAGVDSAAVFPSRPPTAAVPEEASANGDGPPLPPVSPLATPPPVPVALKAQLVGARRVVVARVAYAEAEFGAANQGDLSELRALDKELLLLARAPKDPNQEVRADV